MCLNAKQNGDSPFCFFIGMPSGNVWFGANVNEKMGYFISW
ncbi:hypothetical protein [Vibrio vulnificus YJ016]|uniref:Uncharacterized protein n=1 Tax=Vibrio vulnificus (strain YJ016) TaxID=196600 RepID=Q7MKU0_VIBVY|nr:hypothetical protein [Vibrio vulnificus YJ016]